jgi:FkbM family methyltransferase
VWVEPIPGVFRILQKNILEFPKQRAFNYLVADEDGKQYEFHIANNAGASSSMLDLARHREMWPEVIYTSAMTLTGVTLKKLLERELIDIRKFDALVLDTQGSEYKILMGAKDLLKNFKFVKVEVPDFESYKECCQIRELSSFMLGYGFREDVRIPFMHVPEVGTYFEVVYKRVGSWRACRSFRALRLH